MARGSPLNSCVVSPVSLLTVRTDSTSSIRSCPQNISSVSILQQIDIRPDRSYYPLSFGNSDSPLRNISPVQCGSIKHADGHVRLCCHRVRKIKSSARSDGYRCLEPTLSDSAPKARTASRRDDRVAESSRTDRYPDGCAHHGYLPRKSNGSCFSQRCHLLLLPPVIGYCSGE